MRLRDVFTPALFTAEATDTLSETARRMDGAQVGSLPVFAKSRLVGILTERDLVRAIGTESRPQEATIEPYISRDLQTADIDDDTRGVARRMLDLGLRHLPVLRDGELVGIVSMRDLVTLEILG